MIDFEALMAEPNDSSTYHPHIIESAYSGMWIDATTYQGSTPLHIASNLNLHKQIDSLLETGGNINCINYMGETPLHCAIQWDNMETAYKIITNDKQVVDFTITDKNGGVAFDYCEYDSKCYRLYDTLIKRNMIPPIPRLEKIKLEEKNILQTLSDYFVSEYVKNQLKRQFTKKEVFDIIKEKFPELDGVQHEKIWTTMKQSKDKNFTIQTTYIKNVAKENLMISVENVTVDFLFS